MTWVSYWIIVKFFLTYQGINKMDAILQMIFYNLFSFMKTMLYFDSNFTEIPSQESSGSWEPDSIVSDNGLAQNRRQVTTWWLPSWMMHICALILNTLRPRQMDAILQMTFSNAFSWMKIHQFWLIFPWSLFLRVELTISKHWFR